MPKERGGTRKPRQSLRNTYNGGVEDDEEPAEGNEWWEENLHSAVS